MGKTSHKQAQKSVPNTNEVQLKTTLVATSLEELGKSFKVSALIGAFPHNFCLKRTGARFDDRDTALKPPRADFVVNGDKAGHLPVV